MEFINLDDYQKETSRTSPSQKDIYLALVNFSMGLSGESSELIKHFHEVKQGKCGYDNMYIAKELGDISWYTARTMSVMGYKMSEFWNDTVINALGEHSNKSEMSSMHDRVTDLTIISGEILDNVKKVAFQGHDLDTKYIIRRLVNLFTLVIYISIETGYNVSGVLKMNVEKLRKRYPNGFSVDDSVNRDE